jgi:hypothetical protein
MRAESWALRKSSKWDESMPSGAIFLCPCMADDLIGVRVRSSVLEESPWQK